MVSGGGVDRFEMSAPRRCSLRARSLSGDCGAVKRAFTGDVAHRRVSSLARFVVRSRLGTEKVQALLQEVTELEREVARAHARSRRGNQGHGRWGMIGTGGFWHWRRSRTGVTLTCAIG